MTVFLFCTELVLYSQGSQFLPALKSPGNNFGRFVEALKDGGRTDDVELMVKMTQ